MNSEGSGAFKTRKITYYSNVILIYLNLDQKCNLEIDTTNYIYLAILYRFRLFGLPK
jgi:hypothetical protein